MLRLLKLPAVLSLLLLAGLSPALAAPTQAKAVKVTLLSTMLADGAELGEWGFAALVEVDDHCILFDTGMHPDVVLKNARSLGLDLSTVPDVILSHNHSDHVGGLLTLRESVVAKNPAALARVHVAEGIFYPRHSLSGGIEDNPMILIRPQFEKSGGTFVVHRQPVELYPGVWLTGPVPRQYPERNWSDDGKVQTPAGLVEDNVPEDQALIIDTPQGLVAIFGCGHAGVINTLEYARAFIRPARIHALIGGIHIFAAPPETWAWTADKLRTFGVDHLIGAHCTGIEAVYYLRQPLGLDRAHAVVGAVGSTFELGRGINPRNIAK